MNKIILAICISFSLNANAQFIKETPPTEYELSINNTDKVMDLLKLAAIAKAVKSNKDYLLAMEKIVLANPNVPIFNYQLAEAYALNDDKTNSFNTLIQLQKQGLYFDLDKNDALNNIKPFPVYDYIRDNMAANGQHFGEGVESFNINKSFSGLLFESIAFDSVSQSFLMGSFRDGSVIKINNDGETTVLIPESPGGVDGPWATIDIAVDNGKDELWVASAAISQYGKLDKKSSGSAGLFKYKLSTGKLIKSYLIPEVKKPSLITAMHLTSQGDVYFIDAIKNLVLKLDNKTHAMTPVFTSAIYKNMRSVTSDETGQILYISDSEKGIAIVDIKNKRSHQINSSESLNVTGITHLDYDDNGLIMMQSGFNPERIMRLELAENKVQVKNIFPIESSHPDFNSLSRGVVIGNHYYFIANSQISKTNSYGGLLKGKQWENMVILRAAKHYNEDSSLNYKQQIDDIRKETGSH